MTSPNENRTPITDADVDRARELAARLREETITAAEERELGEIFRKARAEAGLDDLIEGVRRG